MVVGERIFIFHLQQTWYKAHTLVRKQKIPMLDNEGIDAEHRCPQEVTFPSSASALSGASAIALGPSPYSIIFAHLGFRLRDWGDLLNPKGKPECICEDNPEPEKCNLLYQYFLMLHSESQVCRLRPEEITSEWSELVRLQLWDIQCY